MGVCCQQQGVAVGLGLGHEICADVASGAGFVLHNQRLAQHRLKPLGQHARQCGGAAAWGLRDDEFDGLLWPGARLGKGWRNAGACQRGRDNCRNDVRKLHLVSFLMGGARGVWLGPQRGLFGIRSHESLNSIT